MSIDSKKQIFAYGKKHQSIQSKITQLFLGFTICLSFIYSFLLLGYSWVIEDNIFNRLVENEARFIIDYYEKHSEITQPRLKFITLYQSWQQLPDNIFHIHQLDPERIEFDLADGGSLHVTTIVLAGTPMILAANVSAFEVSKDYLPFLSFWLLLLVAVIIGCALILSIKMSKKVLKPLKQLTEKVAATKNIEMSQCFANEFPDNEVGYLAKTIEESILHLQSVLQRETDFTRDASHELRTPITILRNLHAKESNNRLLDSKDREIFGDAISRLQLTVTTLLALAREESAKTEDLIFLRVLEDCVVNHYEISQNENFELNIEVPANFRVKANLNLLKILINNLLTNAVNYTTENGLTVKVVGSNIYFENQARLTELERPFDANSRGENSLGIGLGLNLVKRLCDSFGWRVRLDNQRSLFRICISTQ